MGKADAPNIQQLQFSTSPHGKLHIIRPDPTFHIKLPISTPLGSQASPLLGVLHSCLRARPGASHLSIMDVVAAVSGYISKMVTAGESASGSSSTKMKILLLDSETVGIMN